MAHDPELLGWSTLTCLDKGAVEGRRGSETCLAGVAGAQLKIVCWPWLLLIGPETSCRPYPRTTLRSGLGQNWCIHLESHHLKYHREELIIILQANTAFMLIRSFWRYCVPLAPALTIAPRV